MKKNKDILLIVPPKPTVSTVPHLGLGYLASSLSKAGFNVDICDFVRDRMSHQQSVRELLRQRPSYVGLTVFSYNYLSAKKLIASLKQENRNIKFIVGGSHISALPEFSLRDLGADFAIVGEGEEAIVRILGGAGNYENIPGLAFRNNGEVKITAGCNLIEDLDKIPLPDWKLIFSRPYDDSPGYFFPRNSPSAPVLTSRGCPHHCSFCSSRLVHGTKLRLRSPQSVVDEIEMLNMDFGIREIDFVDDSFTENRPHALDIFEGIIRRKINITWKTPVGIRLDSLDRDLLFAMRKSGCYQLGFGIESFNDDVLRLNRKPLDKFKIDQQIRLVKTFGIETMGFFILGLPGDTLESINETINFACRSPFDLVSFSCAVPFPGTKMFASIYPGGNLDGIDWEKFYFNNQFAISEVPPATLNFLFHKAFISAYLRFERLPRLLKKFFRLKPSSLRKILRYIYNYVVK